MMMTNDWIYTTSDLQPLVGAFAQFTVVMERSDRVVRRLIRAIEAAKEQRRCDVFQRCLERDAVERRAYLRSLLS